jgi:hypothetical protein
MPRILLAFAALLQAIGGYAHASAFFRKMSAAMDASDLSPFLRGSFKGLWLADSTTMFSVAVILAFIAARPAVASRSLIVLLALIPAATGALIYFYLGPFFAAHLLIATTALIVLGGTLLRKVE